MFNGSLKKSALAVHQNAVERYNQSQEQLQKDCEALYQSREKSLGLIAAVEVLINSIANHPKEFDKELGEVKEHVLNFHQTKEFADEALKTAMKSGASILSGVAAGGAVASAAPTVAMSIATTFGHASTGTAIRTLTGAPAQKAALAWIGRMTGGIATKGVVTGAGMASGQAFLALAGPIGWGITGVTTAVSVASHSGKNKKVAAKAKAEAIQIMEGRELLRETSSRVEQLRNKTVDLQTNIAQTVDSSQKYRGTDYIALPEDAQLLLGSLVNNTNSLAALLNEVIA